MAVPYTFANANGRIQLSQLDVNFANVAQYSATAGTVTQNSQPNITAVGKLTTLSISGNLNVDGNINGNITITSLPVNKVTGLATVATSGVYGDLSNKPFIPSSTNDLQNDSGYITGSYVTWSNISGKPTLSAVATSGSYTDLSNTPVFPSLVSAFTNDAGYITAITANVVSVNGQTGIVNIAIPTDLANLTDATNIANTIPLTLIRTETGNFQPTSGDHGYYIRMNNTVTANITLASDATEAIPVGTTLVIGRVNTGAVQFLADSGTTIYSPASLILAAQWAKATAIKVAADTWEIDGNLAP